MSELPYKLAKGEHKVVVGAVRDNPLTELKAAVDRNYVHVKFTETRGGTELGFRLDPAHSDLSKADFANGAGEIRLAGNLKLDGVPVRCVADIDLGKMEGWGHLEILEEATPAAN
ncbi:MAG TPA: MbtH domain protein [Thermoanaerobaculia bacterium]|nr:MbtH domain protein [Thermoanaerobaculia bacterium]